MTTTTVTVTINGADDDVSNDDLNTFFGQIDEATFQAVSGFVNGLVDISRDGSEAGSNGVQNAGTAILGAFGGDTGYVTGETPLTGRSKSCPMASMSSLMVPAMR